MDKKIKEIYDKLKKTPAVIYSESINKEDLFDFFFFDFEEDNLLYIFVFNIFLKTKGINNKRFTYNDELMEKYENEFPIYYKSLSNKDKEKIIDEYNKGFIDYVTKFISMSELKNDIISKSIKDKNIRDKVLRGEEFITDETIGNIVSTSLNDIIGNIPKNLFQKIVSGYETEKYNI